MRPVVVALLGFFTAVFAKVSTTYITEKKHNTLTWFFKAI